MVAAMPAPRFYINAETASRQYNRYKRGVSNIHEVEKRKMYAEVFARYENKIRLLKESGQRCSKLDIWESILLQEAPSFYYSGMSSVVAYYKALALIKKYKITV